MLTNLATNRIRSWLAPYTHLRGARRVLNEFRPKESICLQRGPLTVKTAESVEELERVLKLRHDVFHAELLGRRLPFGLEFDRFDAGADHLMVIDERTERVVGTYRLTASNFASSFYSQSEFALEDFLSRPGGKLELSRACIHPEHRDGMVIHLLWRGMVAYWQKIDASFLFGCASVKTTDRGEIAFIYQYLRECGHLAEDFTALPLPGYEVEQFDEEVERWQKVGRPNLEPAKALLPPLFLGYLRAGAKVYGRPALDRDFRCVDFLTVLKRDAINSAYERKYAR
jgi:putative hemolysin